MIIPLRMDDFTDLHPAYPVKIDSRNLDHYIKMIILSTIRRAIMDHKNPGYRNSAEVWLKTTGRTWLEDMGVSRGGKQVIIDLIYGGFTQLPLEGLGSGQDSILIKDAQHETESSDHPESA